jgi:Zn-finger nucleic acid-binding protein
VRTLVGCTTCKRQYDASGSAIGSRFRCACGEVVLVQRITPHDADVVRCSSCGASREEGAAECRYCGSDFTIHEADLDTICPSCFARIGDRARFCHHCATPIVPTDVPGATTPHPCPACGSAHPLASRALGQEDLPSLECRRCAGLWLSTETFRILSERARKQVDPSPDPASIRRETSVGPARPATGPAYRPCPVCSKRMNRANFGQRSGILVDRCRDHGIWFDASELDAALRWVRSGGEVLAEARRHVEERESERAARFRVEPRAPDTSMRSRQDASWEEGGLLPALLRFLVRP